MEIHGAEAPRVRASASVSPVYLRRHVTSLIAKIAAIPFLALATVLLLSDRAPALTRGGLRMGLVVGRKVEGRTGIDLIDHNDIPFSWEQVGHAGLWAVALVLASSALARRASLFQVASGVLAVSAAFELGQFFLTDTRQLEWADLAANSVGLALGVLAVVTAGLIERLVRHPGVSPRSITG